MAETVRLSSPVAVPAGLKTMDLAPPPMRPVRTAAGPVVTVGSKLPLSVNLDEASPSMNVFHVALNVVVSAVSTLTSRPASSQ